MDIFRERVTQKQVFELYQNLFISLLGLIGVAGVIAVTLYGEYRVLVVLYWFVLLALISFARLILRHWVLSSNFHNQQIWYIYRLYLVTLAFSSLVFSSLPFFFYPPDAEFEIFLFILITGIVSSGVVQTAYTKLAMHIFLLSSLAPLVLFFVFHDTAIFKALSATLLFYYILISKIGSNIYRKYLKNEELKQRYLNLIQEHEVDRQRMEHFFNYTPIGIFFYTKQMRVSYANEFLASKIIGVDREKLFGLDLNKLRDQSILPALKEALRNGHGEYEGHYHTTMTDKDLWLKLIASRVQISSTDIEGVAVMVDLSDLKEAQEEIEHLAFYDELTNLPKRALIISEIDQAIAHYKREHYYSALLYFDLDKFKEVNDVFGHNVGDKFLQHIATQIQQSIRQSDIVARMGGDEFAIVAPKLSMSEHEAASKAVEIAKRVQRFAAKKFIVQKHPFEATLSMGIVMIDDSYTNPFDVIKDADSAMYKSKEHREGLIVLFDTAIEKEIQERYRLTKELQIALQEHQFELFLQPKLNKEEDVIGAEALIRWRHPTQGLLAPAYF